MIILVNFRIQTQTEQRGQTKSLKSLSVMILNTISTKAFMKRKQMLYWEKTGQL